MVALVSWLEDVITVKDMDAILKTMTENKSYKEVVFYVEACYSGSVFENIVPKYDNVLAITAANDDESSYATYCDRELDTCLGDWFSISWMEYSDKHDLRKTTIEEEYKMVQERTYRSHVSEYGDDKILDQEVSQIQGDEEPEDRRVYGKVTLVNTRHTLPF
ncbi:unnamed protein product [Bursaphelenchus okinawaensis]|uniref:Legumain n=1 Tax=Bursaphelenchus okinawaensis TaxID=465554 RepID=A0A811KD18_9BILA|nr:unnamed protein product [Bursaphelenchus okinawaensis]CAG9101281.1 unnamed protein product [Bursaphelenchus okinawaensis]